MNTRSKKRQLENTVVSERNEEKKKPASLAPAAEMDKKKKQEKNPFEQLCVWPNAPLIEDGNVRDTMRLLEKFGFRVFLAEVVVTLPGQGGPGGRTDVLFYIHNDDIVRFSLQRFSLLQESSGRMYGLAFRQQGRTVEEHARFYADRGVEQFTVELECEKNFVFSFRLFDIGTEDQPAQLQHANRSLDSFIAADNAFKAENNGQNVSASFSCGTIRWWEDVLANGRDDIYPRAIIEKYRAAW